MLDYSASARLICYNNALRPFTTPAASNTSMQEDLAYMKREAAAVDTLNGVKERRAVTWESLKGIIIGACILAVSAASEIPFPLSVTVSRGSRHCTQTNNGSIGLRNGRRFCSEGQ